MLGCTSLENFSVLPSNVENLTSTFSGCCSLKNGPDEIPQSVTSMMETFRGCENLQGYMQINANITPEATYAEDPLLTYYDKCFYRACINEEASLYINGICPALIDIINTKSNASNIFFKN